MDLHLAEEGPVGELDKLALVSKAQVGYKYIMSSCIAIIA
jgi:hypothetical protein